MIDMYCLNDIETVMKPRWKKILRKIMNGTVPRWKVRLFYFSHQPLRSYLISVLVGEFLLLKSKPTINQTWSLSKSLILTFKPLIPL